MIYLLILLVIMVSCGSDTNKKDSNRNEDIKKPEDNIPVEIPKVEVHGQLGKLAEIKMFIPCSNDILSRQESVLRTEWAYKCNYISERSRDFYIYDENKEIREIPFYPTFSSNDFVTYPTPTKVENATECHYDKLKNLKAYVCKNDVR